jgi:putative acetyltransferase
MATVTAGMTVSLDGFVADRQGCASRLYPNLADLRGTNYMNAAIEEIREGAVVVVSERIRPYRAEDAAAVREVHLQAFDGREDEARLVELLHAAGAAPVSLVAATEPDGRVVGHLLFSPVQIDGCGSEPPMMVGLAPVGVLPEYQGRGIGSRLIREGLDACREAGYGAAVVLGEPGYYFRFGFERASEKGLGNEYGVDEHFMVAELDSGALDGVSGTVCYREEFREISA